MTLSRELTDEDKTRIAELATSYVLGVSMVQAEFELDIDVIDDVLLDQNIEKCSNCGWYDQSFNLFTADQDEPDGCCSNCR
jgi:hypothetical protein